MNHKGSRLLLVPIFSFLSFFLPANAAASQFDGRWEREAKSEKEGIPFSVFSLTLKSDGKKISGQYCYVTQYGRKIDCDTENNPNIRGYIDLPSKTAHVEFFSYFGGTDGRATIDVKENHLTWQVTKEPIGEFYGPLTATLIQNEGYAGLAPGERKILVDRAYFYSAPQKKEIKGTYVVKGDVVKLIELSADQLFWKVHYKSSSGKSYEQWIRCGDIGFCP